MRKALIVMAVINVFASLSLVFWLSMSGAFAQLIIMDRAHDMEVSGAIDYEKLGAGIGKAGPANRDDLEESMGIRQVGAYRKVTTAMVLLTVLQTGALVFCALRIPGDRRPSPAQPAAPGGNVPQG